MMAGAFSPGANTKKITFHRITIGEEGTQFLGIKQESLINASIRLNGKKASGFKLWVLFCLNSDSSTWQRGNDYYRKNFGLSKDSYDTGMKYLQEQGFLVLKEGKTVFDFYEYPEAHRSMNCKSGETPLLDDPKVGKPYFQKGGNPTFKSGETPQEINSNSIYINNTCCSSCSNEEYEPDPADTTTTTTTTDSFYLQKLGDRIIKEEYPILVSQFGFDIVEDSLKQAYEGGSERRNLRYIRAACSGKLEDRRREELCKQLTDDTVNKTGASDEPEEEMIILDDRIIFKKKTDAC